MTMTACSTTSPSRCATARRAAASQHALKVSASHGVSTRAAADPGPARPRWLARLATATTAALLAQDIGTGSALLIRSGRARCNRRMAVGAGVGPRLPMVVIMLIRTDDAALDARPSPAR